MIILQVHNAYQLKGGEDKVRADEFKLLESKGESVHVFEVSNKQVNKLSSKIKVAFNTPYSKTSKDEMARQIALFNPDIVHIHNFFPLLTPSIYDACIEAKIPVVQTLHNYRTICPGALLMRDRKICEICISHSAYHAVLHRCYRNSYLGSWFVARMVSLHRRLHTWQNKVNRFIALTEFSKKKFIEAGFPDEKISVKSNFYSGQVENNKKQVIRVNQALFVGRLSEEKGLVVLLEAWKQINFKLLIAGNGPLLSKYNNEDLITVQYLGGQTAEEISKLMSVSTFLVIPSIWYEGFPMVIVEAFAHGLPVICSRLGGMSEIVEDGITGLCFETNNTIDLAEKVNWIITNPKECQKMGDNARKTYFEKYIPDKNYEMLINIYQEGINSI